MSQRVIVVHYHELWLKGRNRGFFLNRLLDAIRRTLEGVAVERIDRPGDRVLIWFGDGADIDEAIRRLGRVSGIAHLAAARPVERDMDAICHAAWQELESLSFGTFAVRAKRSDKSFPFHSSEIERQVGAHLLERLRAAGRDARVNLNEPELTCRIEITPGPALVYARKVPGPGGLPPGTAGKLVCLLSGGFDSAVAAYKMMKRGGRLIFAHFYGSGARPGESSVHVARELVRQLTPYQLTARLYLVPFEPIQREIVRFAPEQFRVLLYRRMMLRIGAGIAARTRALALVTGDSLGQVASQTLENMIAVDNAVGQVVFRPLVGDDKQEILALARRIGTYDISAEPFHDCCPVFLPRSPALRATAAELDGAEAQFDIPALVRRGLETASLERYRLVAGRVMLAHAANLSGAALPDPTHPREIPAIHQP
ncbi:MAG TPA: tRNA uracil 4-sulfurtransferase ThiI [Candidatus Acidoferrales bacterium]|nr:tRNA uracil 4-sulfurtransferase ThiI [Candidatus Acidoferrales bacterium]